jgi:hypothetical protein
VRAKLLLRFFLIGGLLALVLRERPALSVRVASAEAVAIDEALLFEYAVHEGWHEVDGVVRQRLLRSLATVDEAAIPVALALGLHREDPVIRARLITLARRALATRAPLSETDRRVIFVRASARAASHTRPARVRFESRSWPLASGQAVPALPSGWTNVPRFAQRYGDAFARALETAPLGSWIGPLRSPFGGHFVRVLGREAAAPCDPVKLSQLVAAEEDAEARRLGLARAIAALRNDAEIVIAP